MSLPNIAKHMHAAAVTGVVMFTHSDMPIAPQAKPTDAGKRRDRFHMPRL
ncbi:MAG: hypothetical protein AAF670_19220 [Planctomycetota bacterium]